MKNLYKIQISTAKNYIRNIITTIIETYNGTMYFK
jgi:hypothetical protein